MIKNNIFVNKEVILMTSSKKDNFMDKFTNYFNNVYHHNDIQRIVYNHINLKELEEKIARKKKELDNPKKKNYKTQVFTTAFPSSMVLLGHTLLLLSSIVILGRIQK